MYFHYDPTLFFNSEDRSLYIALRTDYYFELMYERSSAYYGKIEQGEFKHLGEISADPDAHSFAGVKAPGNLVGVCWSDHQDIYLWREIEVGVAEEIGSRLPEKARVLSAYPNPFNCSTKISYSLPAAGFVRLEIFNLLGEKVATLMEGVQAAGAKEILWDASDMTSGLYFYKLTVGGFSDVNKMTLLK